MFNKEMLLKRDGQSPVYLTVGIAHGSKFTIVGYSNGSFGSVDKIPHWNGARLALMGNYYDGGSIQATSLNLGNYKDTTIPSAIEVMRMDTGYALKFEYTSSGMFSGNYAMFFSESDKGKVIPLIFTPPPQTAISKKVKTVFTRSRKEGAVNA